jgi:hypothetical protein
VIRPDIFQYPVEIGILLSLLAQNSSVEILSLEILKSQEAESATLILNAKILNSKENKKKEEKTP